MTHLDKVLSQLTLPQYPGIIHFLNDVEPVGARLWRDLAHAWHNVEHICKESGWNILSERAIGPVTDVWLILMWISLSAETDDALSFTNLVNSDMTVLAEKRVAYGDSWKQRGGAGAFFVIARKWDRILNQMSAVKIDCWEKDILYLLNLQFDSDDEEGIWDDVNDLRQYLLLVIGEYYEPFAALIRTAAEFESEDEGKPTGRGYVDQD